MSSYWKWYKITLNWTFILLFTQNYDGSSKASADAKQPAERSESHEEGSATAQTVCSSSTPKKRLMIPLSEKEKLLDWEMKVTSEENPINTKATQQHEDQVRTHIY